jgi:predicted chitinase
MGTKMTETITPAIKFPLVKENGQEMTAEEIHTLLAEEPGGHYLLGTNQFWHGGVHFSDAKIPQHKDKYPIRCLMDGYVVAYRLNNEYPTSEWQNAQLKYSTSFCLVKHNYVSPKNDEEGPNKDKTNALPLYSLYMHLASLKTYQPDSSASYWKFKSDLSVRDGSKSVEPPIKLGKIKAGSIVQLSSDTPEIGKTSKHGCTVNISFAKGTISDVKSGSTVSNGTTIWVPMDDEYTTRCKADGTEIIASKKPSYWKTDIIGTLTQRVSVYSSQDDLKNKVDSAVQIQPGSTFKYQSDKVESVQCGDQAISVVLCDGIDITSATHVNSGPSFWLEIDDKKMTLEPADPTQLDSIVRCHIAIKAGDPIGLLGLYETPNLIGVGYQTQHMVHIELVSDADKNAIAKFLKNEAGLKKGRQYIQIGKGKTAGFLTTDLNGKKSITPYQGSTTEAISYEQASVSKETDKNGVEYYKISDVVIRNNLSDTTYGTGYIKVSDTEQYSQYDLEKLGYKLVEETNENSDGSLIKKIKVKATANDSYRDNENTSAFFQQLFKEVDTDHNGSLSESEISAALKKKTLRNKVNRIIAAHPTEWRESSGFVTTLRRIHDEVTDEISKKLLEHELKRLDKLSFAGVVGLPTKLWHFHPVEMLSGIKAGGCLCDSLITITHLKAIIGDDRVDRGLFENSEYSSTKNIPACDFIDTLNLAFERYEINTCLQKMHFLSQAMHECDYFKATEEYKNRNGSIPSGWLSYDGGVDFHGRGIIQITGDSNYSRYMEAIGIDDKSLIASNLYYLVDSAVWYWRHGSTWGDINVFSQECDFLKVTIAVNGGYIHVYERNKALYELYKIIKCNHINFNDEMFRGFTFDNSRMKTTKWYKHHADLAVSVERDLERFNDEISD